MPLDELAVVTGTLYVKCRDLLHPCDIPDVSAEYVAEFRSLLATFHDARRTLNDRVAELSTALAPRLFLALESADAADLAVAVETFRALPGVVRRWLFHFHCDALFYRDADPFEACEPASYTDSAIARRVRLYDAAEAEGGAA